MGIQAIFSREAAIKAGAVCTEATEVDCVLRGIEVDGNLFCDWGGDDEVMVDFNHWGSIRPVLQPWLEANGIEYREV